LLGLVLDTNSADLCHLCLLPLVLRLPLAFASLAGRISRLARSLGLAGLLLLGTP
jgi:hypothetical protein